MMRDYEDDPLYDLKKELEETKTKLIDLMFEMKTTHSQLTKKELLFSLKKTLRNSQELITLI